VDTTAPPKPRRCRGAAPLTFALLALAAGGCVARPAQTARPDPDCVDTEQLVAVLREAAFLCDARSYADRAPSEAVIAHCERLLDLATGRGD
jgi:hypothetical protein